MCGFCEDDARGLPDRQEGFWDRLQILRGANGIHGASKEERPKYS